ncbi:MBL fold metallo-hydrolase [Alkalihalophilus lindianensis]|uniref:MBL fold metallo-hydrolase n=1 Tax=Alkalihalophilus lindianensis TaxID=1630542 RepID=A0ABU3XD70_9BACI|nr:MBL fold metallo-hydrolase [Alkalihalophilus lindianensis]MDV2685838.1 MBL fold metallo-hydrolase [Alkalihalophilus lindianensis]
MAVKTEKIHCLTIPTPFLVGPVNCYVIEGETLTLVDTGPKTDEGWELLKSGIESIGYSVDDVEQVVLTHHHPDHVGLVARFNKAKVIGHELNQLWLSRDPDFFMQYARFFKRLYLRHGLNTEQLKVIERSSLGYLHFVDKTNVDVFVAHGDKLPGLSDWRVIETPGHAQSHLLFLRESDGVAIGGDVLLSKVSSNALLEAPLEGQERPRTLLQYRESLETIKNLQISELHTGHGPSITDVTTLIDNRLTAQEDRARVIYDHLKSGKMTVNELGAKMFGRSHHKQPELTFSEVFGHLDLLMDDDLIVERHENDLTYFEIK